HRLVPDAASRPEPPRPGPRAPVLGWRVRDGARPAGRPLRPRPGRAKARFPIVTARYVERRPVATHDRGAGRDGHAPGAAVLRPLSRLLAGRPVADDDVG